ncbi:Sulfatase domain-containing protein [Aphelenchoides bicaudatus]|nr:Sulfatase domain-containing protein [Aphelenchoides bicaudatus]
MNLLVAIFFMTIYLISAKYIHRSHHVKTASKRPNILVLMADGLSIDALKSYGNLTQEWTPIDQLMTEGTRFTNFFSADMKSSASRAGFLTGQLPIRLGITGNDFKASDSNGLPLNKVTMSEMLQSAGYYTGMNGKWQLGLNKYDNSDGSYLPSKRGFNYVGLNLPASCDQLSDCFLYYGDQIVQQPAKFENLTEDLVNDWRIFTEQWERNFKSEQPFFFYFSFPQVQLKVASKMFRGSSKNGPLGDSINEMGYAVGEIMTDIRKMGISEETLVIFMSTHGVQHFTGNEADMYEAFRVPFAAWMPGTIQSGQVSDKMLWSLDLFPTFESLAGLNQVQLQLDGTDVWSELTGNRNMMQAKQSTKRPIFFYCNAHPMAYTSKPKDLCSRLQTQYPPLVFNTARNEQYEQVPRRFVRKIKKLLKKHKKIVNNEMLQEQVRTSDEHLVPCCGEKCQCDLLNEDFEVVSRRVNYLF